MVQEQIKTWLSTKIWPIILIKKMELLEILVFYYKPASNHGLLPSAFEANKWPWSPLEEIQYLRVVFKYSSSVNVPIFPHWMYYDSCRTDLSRFSLFDKNRNPLKPDLLRKRHFLLNHANLPRLISLSLLFTSSTGCMCPGSVHSSPKDCFS